MKKKLTFIDSNVLIATATGKGKYALQALTILSDPARGFASSAFVRLETLPKAVFHRQQTEADFYERYFAAVSSWCHDYAQLVATAEVTGNKFGVGMGDALHVAAALLVNADELITAERPTSPLVRVKDIRVTTIYRT